MSPDQPPVYLLVNEEGLQAEAPHIPGPDAPSDESQPVGESSKDVGGVEAGEKEAVEKNEDEDDRASVHSQGGGDQDETPYNPPYTVTLLTSAGDSPASSQTEIPEALERVGSQTSFVTSSHSVTVDETADRVPSPPAASPPLALLPSSASLSSPEPDSPSSPISVSHTHSNSAGSITSAPSISTLISSISSLPSDLTKGDEDPTATAMLNVLQTPNLPRANLTITGDEAPIRAIPIHEALDWLSQPTADDHGITSGNTNDGSRVFTTAPGHPLLRAQAPIFRQPGIQQRTHLPLPFRPLPRRSVSHGDRPAPPATQPAQPDPFASPLAREALLTYAHRLYHSPTQSVPAGLSPIPLSSTAYTDPQPNNSSIYTSQLLPLLNGMRALHPEHLPTLLLLGCVLFAVKDYESSIKINKEILLIEPTYVEAMSNLATTLRALGRNDEAEEWWWKAIRIKPTYWDCLDNLLGSLCTTSGASTQASSELVPPRYDKALELCTFVLSRTLSLSGGGLSAGVPSRELNRLQNLLMTSGNLRLAIERDSGVSDRNAVAQDFFRAFEVMLAHWTARDVLAAVAVFAVVKSHAVTSPEMRELMRVMGVNSASRMLEDLLGRVRTAGDALIHALLRIGRGALPIPLLAPEYALQLLGVLFPGTGGILPGLFHLVDDQMVPVSNDLVQQAHRSTSAAVLMLAKVVQDMPSGSQPLFGDSAPMRLTIAVDLILYYLALAFSPSASICNNLGILLCNVTATATLPDFHGSEAYVNGQKLAMSYYVKGLQFDPRHAHLYTNVGSLLKDQGKTKEAIEMYRVALGLKPDFEVALANIANAARDLSHYDEAIEYYQRAVELNPGLHEAVCGLVNTLTSVCDWRNRGGMPWEFVIDAQGDKIPASTVTKEPDSSVTWMDRLYGILDHQFEEGVVYGKGAVSGEGTMDHWLSVIEGALGSPLDDCARSRWNQTLQRFMNPSASTPLVSEGAYLVRFVERLTKYVQWRWYRDSYGDLVFSDLPDTFFVFNTRPPKDVETRYARVRLSSSLANATAPSVLPFHTLTYPMSCRTMRLIAYSNATRISQIALSQSWLPSHVYPPPRPPARGKLNIGYLSSDLKNHPLAHLMQSVFGLHDRNRFNVFVYASTPSDNSVYRTRIEREAQHFADVSDWTAQSLVQRITRDNIHILINLNAYTKGARNDVFALRPCPVQMAFMGYAASLCAGWCDYLLVDRILAPGFTSAIESYRQELAREETDITLNPIANINLELTEYFDPDGLSEDWIYTEKLIYMPHTAFCTDHKQSFRSTITGVNRPADDVWSEEMKRRKDYRTALFPDLPEDTVIFANFNQLYKICPSSFSIWLRILAKVPNSILWLLRFPPAGEGHLLRTATEWAGEEIAGRIRFTDVAEKEDHVERSRAADLFLDTLECNAHTVAADVLWSGTPLLTWPRHNYKMSSRLGASIAYATGFGDQMIVHTLETYLARAISLAESLSEPDGGELLRLRRSLMQARERSALFDTKRWVRNLEKGYAEAWKRWVEGTELQPSTEVSEERVGRDAGCIWVEDDEEIVLPEPTQA